MKLKLLSWNVGGANDSSKRKLRKAFIRNQKVDLLCIQETKIQPMTEGVVRSLGTGRFLDWRALDASSFAGGILIVGQKVFGILIGRRANFQSFVDSGMWKMVCLVFMVSMVCSPKRKGNAYGKRLG
ncbi:hypothetical protein CK203_050926 [Vitis vinifera]|uniref:Endonuclease/exonuclease/phosphatase domain-containing protein n=1 Tax=Vitis vinifera TaxID=29760 RepID=A0A438GQY1_VITVI|nr:hypothetical protein CK203_050926 [Vitis vinifera]